MPNLSLNWQFWFFGQNLHKNSTSSQKQKKQTLSLCSAIGISLGTKFQLEVTILIFWTKFAQKGYFWSKIEKMKTTIEFCRFGLVYVPNSSLIWEIRCFRLNLPKKGISSWKQKKWSSPLNSAWSNQFSYEISA